MALNCFRYLDFKSFAEVDRITLPEYLLLMKAMRYKQIDRERELYLQAWLTFAAKATKKKGQPVYKKFEKFYDYEARLKEVETEKSKKSRFSGVEKFFKKKEG